MKTKLSSVALLLAITLLAFCLPVFADETSNVQTVAAVSGTASWNGIVADGTVTYLSDLTYTGTTSNASYTPAKNAMYKKAADSGITFKGGSTFTKGFGTHPAAPGTENPVYTEIDVSACTGYDTFYALLSFTSDATAANPIKGEVYFDTVGDGTYVKVAESEEINAADKSAEFILTAKNVKKIKLVTLATGTANASSHTAWANASLYTAKDYVYEETYSGTLPTSVTVPSDSVATPTYQIVDGALVVDNTDGTGEAALQLVSGLPTNVKDYFVEATITLLSLKDATATDSRYIAFGANFQDAQHYISAAVRYNGQINYEQRAGTYGPIAGVSTSNISELNPAVTTVLNQAFTFKIHFHDNTADLYINGQKLMTGTNTVNSATGAIGVMLKKGVKASIDDVHYKVNEYGEASKLLIPDRTVSQSFSMIEYDEVTNPNSNPYGSWMAGQNTKYYLSDMENESLCTGGRTATKDAIYKGTEGAGFKLAQTHSFDKGLGVHPSGDWSEAKELGNGGYVTVDIWEYTNPEGQYACDTFYSAVGLTNKDSKGVWFVVFGDKDDGNGFVQLACSAKIEKFNYGEMNVDIAGVHTLKLVVCADSAYGSSASAWGEASIFKKDADAVKPDYTVHEEENNGGEDDDDIVTKPEVTQKPIVTAAPSTNATTEPASTEKGGCFSAVSGGVCSVIALAIAGVSAIIRKKEQ